MYDTAEIVNEKIGRKQINTIDIGGGIPTSYTEPHECVDFKQYREAIETAIPKFFNGDYRILTEFGRSVFVKSGVILSKVFTTKDANLEGTAFDRVRAEGKQNPIIFAHCGSNTLVREAYNPDKLYSFYNKKVNILNSKFNILNLSWRRRFSMFNLDGSLKEAEVLKSTDIAGPLCFQGDYICKNVPLPEAKRDDLIVVHDCGGYTRSLYSRFNSRPAHAVYGIERVDGDIKFHLFKAKETDDEVLSFWGSKEPLSTI